MKALTNFLNLIALFTLSMALLCIGGCNSEASKSEVSKAPKQTTMDPGMNMDKSGTIGLTVINGSSEFKMGSDVTLKFKLSDATNGKTVTKLEATHGKPLHFVVVDDGLGNFQHLHPSMADDGTWTQNVVFPSGGRYYLFADGKVGNSGFAARQEVNVTGPPSKNPTNFAISKNSKLGEISATIVEPSNFTTGSESLVRLKLSRPDGWQPYLEAPGHLILIRKEGDEFIHAHPAEDMKDGVVEFMADFKKAGAYRAWAQFQHDGKVLTFPFTLEVSGKDMPAMSSMNMDHSGH